MGEIWTLGIPILVADVANPVLFAAVILCLTCDRPYATSIAVVAGHTASYLAFGLLIVFGLAELFADLFAPVIEWFKNPVPTDYLIGFIVGVLLVFVAWRWKVAPPDAEAKEPEKVQAGVLQAFGFGAVINFIGLPFALPYLAFVNQLHDLGDNSKIVALVIYNALYALPFLLVPLMRAIMGEAILPTLERLNKLVEKYAAYIMPVILGGLGLVMIVDAGKFLFTGKGLY